MDVYFVILKNLIMQIYFSHRTIIASNTLWHWNHNLFTTTTTITLFLPEAWLFIPARRGPPFVDTAFGWLSFCSCGRSFYSRMPFLAPTFSVREGPLAFGQPRPMHKAVHPIFSPLTIRRDSGDCILQSQPQG